MTSGKIPQKFITSENYLRLQDQLQSGMSLTTSNTESTQLSPQSDSSAVTPSSSSAAGQKSLTAEELLERSAQLGKGEGRKLPPIKMPPSMSSLQEESENPLRFKVKTKVYSFFMLFLKIILF